jgi:hypothetical protein
MHDSCCMYHCCCCCRCCCCCYAARAAAPGEGACDGMHGSQHSAALPLFDPHVLLQAAWKLAVDWLSLPKKRFSGVALRWLLSITFRGGGVALCVAHTAHPGGRKGPRFDSWPLQNFPLHMLCDYCGWAAGAPFSYLIMVEAQISAETSHRCRLKPSRFQRH